MHAPIIVQAVEKHLQKVIFKVLFDILTSWGWEVSECWLHGEPVIDVICMVYVKDRTSISLLKIRFFIVRCRYYMHIPNSFALFIAERKYWKAGRRHRIWGGGDAMLYIAAECKDCFMSVLYQNEKMEFCAS
jgi:hypothetical protein